MTDGPSQPATGGFEPYDATTRLIHLEPGTRATGWLRAVKELHEGGQPVVLAYLAIHVGAVAAHAVAGEPIWRRMFPWRKPGVPRA